MPKLYTGKGDSGSTQLGAARGSKVNPISALIGQIDQLHGLLGWLDNHISEELPIDQQPKLKLLIKLLIRTAMDHSSKINQYFHQDPSQAPEGDSDRVVILEKWIQHWSDQIPPLKEFVVMTNMSPAVLTANDCRILTRDIERNWIACGGSPQDPDSSYWNRLSSFFFALSLYLHHCSDCALTVRSELAQLEWPQP